jgi:hypothetical protein
VGAAHADRFDAVAEFGSALQGEARLYQKETA